VDLVDLFSFNRKLLWLIGNVMEIGLNQLPLANRASAVRAPPELNALPAVLVTWMELELA